MTGEQYLELPREKWDPLATASVFLCALMLLVLWAFPGIHPLVWDELSVAAGLRPPEQPFPGVYRCLMKHLFGGLGDAKVLALVPWLGRVSVALAATAVYRLLRDILPAMLRLRARIGRVGGIVGRLVAGTAALLFLCADPVWRAAQAFSPTTLFICLVVAIVALFFRFVRKAVVAPLYLCFALLGVLSAETPLGFVLLLLVVTGILLAASWAANPAVPLVNPFVDGLVRSVAFRRLVNLYGFCFAATLGLNVWLFMQMGGAAAAGVASDALGVLFICLRNCISAVTDSASPVALLFAFLLALVPCFLSVRLLPRAWDDDRFLPFLLGVLYIVLGVVALSQLAGARILWFWNWQRSGSMVQSDIVLAFILMFDVAAAAFALAVFGVDACCRNYRRIAQKTFPESMQVDEAARLAESLGRNRALRRRIFWGVLVLIPVLVLPGRRQAAERGMMGVVEDYVQEVLRETRGCDTLFTDGSYDSYLELRARAADRKLNCLSLLTPNSPRERLVRLRAAESDEDRQMLENDASSPLRTWIVSDTNRLARTAVQVGLEFWKRLNRPLPPLSGLTALPGGIEPSERLRALAACETIAEKIYDLAKGHVLAASVDRRLKAVYPVAGFRLARTAQYRSRAADEAGRRRESFREAAMADELDSMNYELAELRSRQAWKKRQQSGVLTPREGLVIGLSRADFALAGQYAAPILRTDPDEPRANFALGMKFYQEEQWSRAASHLRRCLVRRPDEVAVLNNLAVVEMKLDQLDDAEKHARRALELHPELKDVQSTLDKILRLKTERKRK